MNIQIYSNLEIGHFHAIKFNIKKLKMCICNRQVDILLLTLLYQHYAKHPVYNRIVKFPDTF
jgi:hypothetical protein